MGQFTVRKEQIVNSLVSRLASSAFEKNPFFPDLLKQPEVLIIPRRGKMLVTFIYASPQRIGWRTALAWVEDLIEVKLNVGNYVIVTALVITESDNVSIPEDIHQLLSFVFEGFFLPNVWKTAFASRGLYQKLVDLQLGDRLNDFLRQEREQVAVASERFDKERYAHLINKDVVPHIRSKELVSIVKGGLELSLGHELTRGPLIHNIKGQLGNLGKSYAFEFDFGMIDRNDLAIDVVSSDRYGSREKIRYLMAKGRMLRYRVENGRLQSLAPDFRPILIVDGNIAGPDHDPYRYVRALISVGWELISIDQMPIFREILELGHV